LTELLQSGGSATAKSQAAKYVIDRLSVNSPLSADLARRAVYAEIGAESALALPAARARLDRLIEARATVLAEEMYEERKRLETEAVKAELADTTVPAKRGWRSCS
jgi:hypothetical protein